ncbi:MAG: hypothetical protein HY698_16770 [Deltaproteobacteria bacterium]|nr:hypothetical protein [Deltaproteobacteria bacterium]
MATAWLALMIVMVPRLAHACVAGACVTSGGGTYLFLGLLLGVVGFFAADLLIARARNRKMENALKALPLHPNEK